MQATINYIPSANGARRTSAEGSRENAPPLPSRHPSAVHRTPQERKLSLQNARLRPSRIPTRNTTPLSITADSDAPPFSVEASESSPSWEPSPALLASRPSRPRLELDVLTEISNSSARRRKRQEVDMSSERSAFDSATSTPQTLSRSSSNDQRLSMSMTGQPDSALDPMEASKVNAESRKRRKSASRRSGAIGRSITDSEAARYIEHLETQLAAASAHPHSSTSPAALRSQGAKLRMLHSESMALRQQLAEWETRFAVRVQEQVEEHQYIVDTLRSQLDAFQQERELDKQRLRELEMQCDEKDQALLVTESAKYDLERRVEFLSELLANSTTKIDLYGDASPSVDHPRRRSVRPRSIISNRGLSALLMSSDRRSFRFGSFDEQRPSSRPTSKDSHVENPFAALLEQSDSGYSTEQFGEQRSPVFGSSEGEISPTNRLSWIRSFPPLESSENKSRPSRRMRRFHSGSTGPRSLILPAATHVGGWPASAPATDTASHKLSPSCESNRSNGLLKPPGLSEGSCLWFPTRQRNSSAAESVTETEPISRESSTSPSGITLMPPNVQIDDYSSDSGESLAGENSATISRVVSMSSLLEFNLFEELGRLRDLSGEADTTLRPEMVFSPLLDEDEANEVTPLASAKQSPHERLESSPEHEQVFSVLPNLSSYLSESLENFAEPARLMVGNAWEKAILSRPVIEFRWWLISILIKGLRRRALLIRRERALNTTASVGLGLVASPGVALMSNPIQEDAIKDPNLGHSNLSRPGINESNGVQDLGPITWTKFSMTMVVAIGLAIRDGPASLFQSSSSGSYESNDLSA